MSDWLLQKGQVDFGNLAVGVATIIIAFVTLYVSILNIHGVRSQKLADLRSSWLDDLRQHLASFGGVVHEIMLSENKSDKKLIEKIGFETTYIRLKLKDSSRTQRMSKIMHDLQVLALHEKTKEFQDLFAEFFVVSEEILQEAWNDIMSDLEYEKSSSTPKKGK
jgi:hypothetical protein